MSQAAGTFTRPGPAGNCGIGTPGPDRSSTTRRSAANWRASRTGLVKKDPALRLSGSAGSRTMPLLRRSWSTAERTSPSGARAPSSWPPSSERAGQLVAGELEGHFEDHKPAGHRGGRDAALEGTGPVAEPAVSRGQVHHL